MVASRLKRDVVEFEGTLKGKLIRGQAISVEAAKEHAKAAGIKNVKIAGGEK